MPKTSQTPKYRRHKARGTAVVTLNGRNHYLGAYGSPASWEKYHRVVGEWLASGRTEVPRTAAKVSEVPTVTQILTAYLTHAEGYYRAPDGQPTLELSNMRDAVRPLSKLYGETPARDFGPLALRAVRDEMVRSGLARGTVNARIHRVRRVFRWAASVELIPASVAEGLRTVDGLKRGRSKAPETKAIAPVPIEHVEATLPHLSRAVAAMVRVQLLSGCRASEVCAMRGCDLTPGPDVWEYRPDEHKMGWRGKAKVILLGPRAVEVVKPFLGLDPTAYLFDPRRTVAEFHATRPQARHSCKAREKHRPRYDRRAYRQAIVRACKRAGVPRWTPGRLRHSSATAIRARFGLEVAQAVLGHARADVTQVYAEINMNKAREAMQEVG